MFTGLIETIGKVAGVKSLSDGKSFRIECRFDSGEYELGESIAVDGVCVTVEEFDAGGFTFSASEETLRRSTLVDKRIGHKVHLERALRLGDRLGGHIVQGHVDDVGRVLQLKRKSTGADLVIEIPETLRSYVVEKGSLAVQGVSLTVAAISAGNATLALIPATLQKTYLGDLKSGDGVNLEVDVLAKYVESLLPGRRGGIDEEKLRQWGFG